MTVTYRPYPGGSSIRYIKKLCIQDELYTEKWKSEYY